MFRRKRGGKDIDPRFVHEDGHQVGDSAEVILRALAEKHGLPAPEGYNAPGEYIARCLLVMMAELGLTKKPD